MREVYLETLQNINIRDQSHNKNIPIIDAFILNTLNIIFKQKLIMVHYIQYSIM